ncbi:hypothetical protein C8R46DRAFT_1029476 [Mycena filopes]|nr:hypothetical protein C8R46DRAFT_1029476 [Mycena filopes]
MPGHPSVDFHVYSAFLAFSSVVFDGMIAMPPPQKRKSDEFKDGKHIVEVHDPSSAFEVILPLCYPPWFPQHPAPTLEALEAALVTAGKYLMQGVMKSLSSALMSFVETEPYAVFGIALRRNLLGESEYAAMMRNIVNAAALATLEEPFLSRSSDIATLPAHALVQLHEFRAECATGADDCARGFNDWILLDDLEFLDPQAVWWIGSQGHSDGCGALSKYPSPDPNAPGMLLPAQWFSDHMAHVAAALHVCPSQKQARTTLLDMRGGPTYQLTCGKCAARAIPDLKQFVLDDLLAKISAHNSTTVQNANFTLG